MNHSEEDLDLSLWRAQSPPSDFAERVVERLTNEGFTPGESPPADFAERVAARLSNEASTSGELDRRFRQSGRAGWGLGHRGGFLLAALVLSFGAVAAAWRLQGPQTTRSEAQETENHPVVEARHIPLVEMSERSLAEPDQRRPQPQQPAPKRATPAPASVMTPTYTPPAHLRVPSCECSSGAQICSCLERD